MLSPILAPERAARLLVRAMRVAARSTETPLHHAATRHERRLAVAVRYAFARGRAAVNADLLRKVIASRANLSEILSPAPVAVAAALREVLPATLLKVVEAGGEAGVGALIKSIRVVPRGAELRTARGPETKIKFKFNARDPRAVDWADRHAAELVTRVSETTRQDINDAIAELLETGDWDAAYEDLLAAVGDDARARLIARHETMTAASEGQRQAWGQAREKGLLSGRAKRVWIVTGDERLCPICEGLDGKTAALDGLYDGEYEGPPAHVACRCTEGIA